IPCQRRRLVHHRHCVDSGWWVERAEDVLVTAATERREQLMSTYSGRGVHGQTVATLGTRIMSGEIPQGEVIDLAALGRELDVSMTVLREATKVLAAKGLV